jgi:hypothetical protein
MTTEPARPSTDDPQRFVVADRDRHHNVRHTHDCYHLALTGEQDIVPAVGDEMDYPACKDCNPGRKS